MLRFVGRLLRVELVAVLLLAGPASLPAFAQAKDKKDDKEKGEPVSFETADGVTLKGLFYPSAKRQAAPGTVLMLHALGDSSQKKDWKELAEELQKKDFAVLIFDFRGHGQSTEVNPPLFWQNPMDLQQYNARLVKGYNAANLRSSIKASDFQSNYYGVLINDIAAAKAFLDRKNDMRECNTSNFILLGAQDGATLGALWLNTEYNRYRVVEDMVVGIRRPEKNPEGKDVIACVWLSMTSALKGRQVPMQKALYKAGRVMATPMLFLYGEKDSAGKTAAKAYEGYVKVAKEKEKYAYTGAVGVPETNLKGAGLLTSGLSTKTDIAKYLLDVAQDKNNEWYNRDYRKTAFIWLNPLAIIPVNTNPMLNGNWFFWAKPVNEMVCNFDSYEKFIPR